MPDVFVSYSREDQAIARRFAEGFEQAGLGVWWDQSLNPGEAFDQVTERALDEARAVVVLWSSTSVNSRWVRAEATQANANGRLMPVMIEPCRRPIMFELTHTADLAHWDGDEEDPAWLAFVASVRRMVAQAGAASAAPPPVESTRPTAQVRSPAPPRAKSPARKPAQIERRTVLKYGAAGVGLAGAGLAGGIFLGAEHDEGATAQPSYLRLTFRRGLIRSARFGPDGKTILYGALWDGDMCRVYSTRTDNPESRPLDLPNANLMAVSRNGDLALAMGAHFNGVITAGTLARVALTGGAPRELVENVTFADWSPDGAEQALIRYVDGIGQIEYPPGRVLFRPPEGQGTNLGFVRISPDGQRVAFVHYAVALSGRVCVVNLAGEVQNLTDTYLNIHGLAWHGDEIWYSATEDRNFLRVVMAVLPGKTPRLVARMPVNVTLWDIASDGRVLLAQTDDRTVIIGRTGIGQHDRDLSWLDASGLVDLSRDGQLVLFHEAGQGAPGGNGAYLRGMDGSPAVLLGNGRPLALSPDARSALLFNLDHVSGAADSLTIVPTGAGDPRSLQPPAGNVVRASWLADGKRILIETTEQGRNRQLHVLDIAQDRSTPIAPAGVGAFWAASPDGTQVAVTGLEPGIHLHAIEGGAVRTVPGTTAIDRPVVWINAGLLVIRPQDPSAPIGEVYVVDPTSGRSRSWTNMLPADAAGIMTIGFPGGIAATADGRVAAFASHRALSNLYQATGLG